MQFYSCSSGAVHVRTARSSVPRAAPAPPAAGLRPAPGGSGLAARGAVVAGSFGGGALRPLAGAGPSTQLPVASRGQGSTQQPATSRGLAVGGGLCGGGGGHGGHGGGAGRMPLRDLTNLSAAPPAVRAAPADDSAALQVKSKQEPVRICEDAEDAGDYAADSLEQLFQRECDYALDAGYFARLRNQPEVTPEMRAVLVDWMVDVHLDFGLKPLTLSLSVHLLDQYLARKAVRSHRLQLAGVVATLVASKFEEDPPRLSRLVYITDNAYTKQDIRTMECHFLAQLGFDVVAPTPQHFLDQLLQAVPTAELHREIAGFLLELSMLELPAARHKPSRRAAAAWLLAGELAGGAGPGSGREGPGWPAAAAHAARYTRSELQPAVAELAALYDAAPSGRLQAVQRKYAARLDTAVARARAVADAGPENMFPHL